MATRTKVFLFVILVGVLTAVISFFKTGELNAFTLLQAGLIAGVLNVIVMLYDHYGWRMPLLKKMATSPNIRGTWRFKEPRIFQLGAPSPDPLSKYRHIKGGYLTVRQSDSHILINVLWDDDEPSEMRIASPTAVNEDRCSFSGIFVERPDDKTHGFGSFFTFSSKYPDSFVLRYRTDNDLTGEIKGENRKPWIAKDKEFAKTRAELKPTFTEKVKFALRWQ